MAHRLSEKLGTDAIASHHDSLARPIRHDAERRLKEGKLKTIVATASLELGIDVGHIDLVCQIGSPRSIATLLQRVGRSGHALGKLPKGRLIPLTRDELLECLALVRAVGLGRIDAVQIPKGALDILAQQIVATVAANPMHEDELFDLCRRARPYHGLTCDDYDEVLQMLGDGYGGSRRGAYLLRDRIHGMLRPRRGARLAALCGGGAIPDTADYRVVTEDDTFVGSVNEDFAIESMAGDIFILGNASWRIRHVREGRVVVRDAHGAPATVPFWLGEAPSRSDELSAEVSELRAQLGQRLEEGGEQAAGAWLEKACAAPPEAAAQTARYVATQRAARHVLPTQDDVVFERFFDESGGMQFVIHAPFGARINRVWGLAMRKNSAATSNSHCRPPPTTTASSCPWDRSTAPGRKAFSTWSAPPTARRCSRRPSWHRPCF